MPERKVYKFKLDPSAADIHQLERAAGARRFVFNWALAKRRDSYKATGKSISWAHLSLELTALKSQLGYEWLKEVDSQLLQQALADCKRAFTNFFEKRARFPKFKKKYSGKQSFRVPQRVKVENGSIYIPKVGWVKIRQSQAVDLPIKSATFKRNASGKWFVTLVAEFHLPEVDALPFEPETSVGIDVGFEKFAATSDGEVIENPRFYRRAERKIKRAHRRFSRRKKGSANRRKARIQLAREYEKISNKRADHCHKFSSTTIRENSTICCETLNLKAMSKTTLGKSVMDAAHRETFRQLEYKGRWNNRNVVFIDRWFPSSQLCSLCGYRHSSLRRDERHWTCPDCGTHHDRDVNAAQNIKNEGLRIFAVGHTENSNACGAGVRPTTVGRP